MKCRRRDLEFDFDALGTFSSKATRAARFMKGAYVIVQMACADDLWQFLGSHKHRLPLRLCGGKKRPFDCSIQELGTQMTDE
jgi:hypothetical protein